MGRGVHRGFITFEELSKSLGKRNLSEENLSQAFIHILNDKISLVEKKSDYKSLRKKDSASKEEGKTIEKSDDPIRMYLREMGGVELLSREGEIAIAKRIEAGKDVMLNALSQSPITAQQFFEWDTKLQSDEILVREIIDIDTNYMEDETTGPSAKQKNSGETDSEESSSDDSDEEFNPTLAAMETEIKPKVLKTVNLLTKDYNKLIKYQKEKLDCVLNSKTFSPAKEKSYEKIVQEILENIKSLQLSPSVLEDLVQKHYVENKKIISLEGNLLRLAMANKISRNEFIKFYVGNEINPNLKTFNSNSHNWVVAPGVSNNIGDPSIIEENRSEKYFRFVKWFLILHNLLIYNYVIQTINNLFHEYVLYLCRYQTFYKCGLVYENYAPIPTFPQRTCLLKWCL